MNWFWLKSQDRKRSSDQRNVTVTEPEAVSVPLVSDAEVRAAEDERRMGIVRDCIEYGRRHYEALPLGKDTPKRCPKCSSLHGAVMKFVKFHDAHSAECDADEWPVIYATNQVDPRTWKPVPLHSPAEREYLHVSCSTCGFERGLVRPADAEVDQ